MIGGVVRHGHTKRDSRALVAHLLRDPGTEVELIHSIAPTLEAAISDMELARDGSAADAAFLHIHLSPSRDMSCDELRRVAAIVASHLEAEEHQAALVFHEKPRQGGEGGRHAHLVLGRVGPDGQVLPAGFEKIRLETAMRLVEFELGEAPTLGRHHASGVKWLRANGRPDVAEWLDAAHGVAPEKPGSAASPAKRQALARQGVDLPAARSIIADSWRTSDKPAAFRAALSEEGFDIAPGNKTGVWIVTSGETEIGALDRLVKEKRTHVAVRMQEERQHAPIPGVEADIACGGDLSINTGDARGRAASPAASSTSRRAGRGESISDLGAEGASRAGTAVAAQASSCDGGIGSESRRLWARRAAAVVLLRKADWRAVTEAGQALREAVHSRQRREEEDLESALRRLIEGFRDRGASVFRR